MTTKKPRQGVDEEGLALGERLRELAELVGGKKEMARLGEISEVQIYRYINGENIPSVRAIARIAAAAGVSLNWLATGEGARERDAAGSEAATPAVLDRNLLAHLLERAADSEALTTMAADKRAGIIADVYADVVANEQDHTARTRMADAVLSGVLRVIA